MSTMKQTLTDIKTVLLTYQNTTLSDLRTYKRGCLPPMPSFPALAILPEKEKIIRRRSNGQQVVERDILIEVYAKAVDRKYAVAQVMDIMEAAATGQMPQVCHGPQVSLAEHWILTVWTIM